jgi:hypothetical protein
MADNHDALPPGFKSWPPADCQRFLREIEAGWAAQPGRNGKHWALQVDGQNPLSGYRVAYQATGWRAFRELLGRSW